MPRTPELMLAGRAAEFLGIGRNTLARWNRQGIGPPRVLKGQRYWYAREILKDWLRSGAFDVRVRISPDSPHERVGSLSASSEFQHLGLPRRFR